MNLADYVRAVPDFPQPGILFWDITPLLLSAEAFRHTLDRLRWPATPDAGQPNATE